MKLLKATAFAVGLFLCVSKTSYSATLISSATGNFTASGSWETVDSTSLLDSNAGNTALTTSYVASSASTPGAITIDGIAVKIASRAASPTGTMSVELYNSTAGASVSGTEVTINVSDIDAGTTAALGGCGWMFFKFGSSQLLLAATNYQVRAKTSSTAQVNLFRDATANNWSRMLRKTTNAAPAAGDTLQVMGEHTGAGTGNDITITMNETATTDYGAIKISKRGTLQYGTSASTNYYLKTSGVMEVFGAGTLNIGTSGTPMPSTSTAVLEFDSTTGAEFGLELRGGFIMNAYGATITTLSAKLAADASASATSLTTDVSTGWLNGDEIAIASTTRTATEGEKKTLSAGASGTTLTIAALTNAHSGTSPTQAHLGNLTRNVKIRGVSSTNTGYISIAATGVLNAQYVEMYQLGSNTALKKGIDCATTTGTTSIRYCSVHDCTPTGATTFLAVGATGTGVTFSDNIVYGNTVGISFSGDGTKTASGNLIIRMTNGTGIATTNAPDIITNNVVSSCTGSGFSVVDADTTIGSFSGNTAYASSTDNFTIAGVLGTMSSLTAWRANSDNYSITLSGQGNVTFDTLTGFGALTSNINLLAADSGGLALFKSVTLNSGSTLTCPTGILVAAGLGYDSIVFEDSSFGGTTTHSTGDVSTSVLTGKLMFFNCLFGSSTEVAGQTTLPRAYNDPGITSDKHDQTSGSFKQWRRYGTLTSDTTIYRTASPSMRMTPNNASNKLMGAFASVKVNSGSTVTVSAYVRESVAGDGTDYNGSRIRLIVRRNAALGITSDTVLATGTVSSEGAFELLSGTTASVTMDGVLEFFVDCDGTTGWVNVDDFSTTSNNDPTGLKYWLKGRPHLFGLEYNSTSGGGSYANS